MSEVAERQHRKTADLGPLSSILNYTKQPEWLQGAPIFSTVTKMHTTLYMGDTKLGDNPKAVAI